jgi:hypothetical protein
MEQHPILILMKGWKVLLDRGRIAWRHLEFTAQLARIEELPSARLNDREIRPRP